MDPTIIVAIIMGIISLGGSGLVFAATNSKTKTDARTAMELRVDNKIQEYMDDLERRLDRHSVEIQELREENIQLRSKARAAETENEKLKRRVGELESAQVITDAREVLIYRHAKALREHIIRGNPPPPPTLPQELVEWFERFEMTDPGSYEAT